CMFMMIRLTSRSAVVTGERSCFVCTSNPLRARSSARAPASRTALTNRVNSRSMGVRITDDQPSRSAAHVKAERSDRTRIGPLARRAKHAYKLDTVGACAHEAGAETIQENRTAARLAGPYRREEIGTGRHYGVSLCG